MSLSKSIIFLSALNQYESENDINKKFEIEKNMVGILQELFTSNLKEFIELLNRKCQISFIDNDEKINLKGQIITKLISLNLVKPLEFITNNYIFAKTLSFKPLHKNLLEHAIYFKKPNIVKLITEKHFNNLPEDYESLKNNYLNYTFNYADEHDEDAIKNNYFVENDYLERLKSLDKNFLKENGGSFFCNAAQNGHNKIISFLYEINNDFVNFASHFHTNALYNTVINAIENKQWLKVNLKETILLLVKLGSNPFYKYENKHSIFDHLYENGQSEFAAKIIFENEIYFEVIKEYSDKKDHNLKIIIKKLIETYKMQCLTSNNENNLLAALEKYECVEDFAKEILNIIPKTLTKIIKTHNKKSIPHLKIPQINNVNNYNLLNKILFLSNFVLYATPLIKTFFQNKDDVKYVISTPKAETFENKDLSTDNRKLTKAKQDNHCRIL